MFIFAIPFVGCVAQETGRALAVRHDEVMQLSGKARPLVGKLPKLLYVSALQPLHDGLDSVINVAHDFDFLLRVKRHCSAR
jgi:hypothetical protein